LRIAVLNSIKNSLSLRQVLALAGEEAAERAFLLAQRDGPASAAARKLTALRKSTSDDDFREEMDVDGPASGAVALLGAIEAWLMTFGSRATFGDKANGSSSANGSNSNISDASGASDHLRSTMRSFWPAAVSFLTN